MWYMSNAPQFEHGFLIMGWTDIAGQDHQLWVSAYKIVELESVVLPNGSGYGDGIPGTRLYLEGVGSRQIPCSPNDIIRALSQPAAGPAFFTGNRKLMLGERE